jgi:hypothetical protein
MIAAAPLSTGAGITAALQMLAAPSVTAIPTARILNMIASAFDRAIGGAPLKYSRSREPSVN